MLGYCYCRSKKRASFDVVGSASADETDSVPDRYSRPDQSYDCEDGRFHPVRLTFTVPLIREFTFL
eukprot:m.178864 g.178864  ORF g.178864 m.178864 type:complete len:66 (+) comp39193_c0_seq15:303-500(+)